MSVLVKEPWTTNKTVNWGEWQWNGPVPGTKCSDNTCREKLGLSKEKEPMYSTTGQSLAVSGACHMAHKPDFHHPISGRVPIP